MLPTLNVNTTVIGPVLTLPFSANVQDYCGLHTHRNQTSRYWSLWCWCQSRWVPRCRNRQQQMEIIRLDLLYRVSVPRFPSELT